MKDMHLLHLHFRRRLDRFSLLYMRRRLRRGCCRFVSHFLRVKGRGRRAGLGLVAAFAKSRSALPQRWKGCVSYGRHWT